MSKSTYFRISLTDSCNLACYFCHNEGQAKGRGAGVTLLAEDILWMGRIAMQNGYTKFKLTGGEPSRHPEIFRIIEGLAGMGVRDLSMITNGHKLKEYASEYRRLGLHRLNVSLYSLDPVKFRKNNGGTETVLRRVLEGIDEAISCGYTDMKLNYVWDGDEILEDFLKVCGFAAVRGLTVVLLPVLRDKLPGQEGDIELKALYAMLQQQGIYAEKMIRDAEGLIKNLVTLNNGAKVLIRMEELKDKFPYQHCGTCTLKSECREGIFPTRLSAKGNIHPCLADTGHKVELLQVIKARNEAAAHNALQYIRTL